MRKKLLISALVVVLLAVASHEASSAGKRPEKDAGHARKLVLPGGLGASELPLPESEGASLFVRYCNRCHNLPNPTGFSSDEWPQRFRTMTDHMQTMSLSMREIKMPSMDEESVIVDYLKRNGLKTIPADDPSLKGDEAFDFVWFCSTCHNLPDPSVHNAKDWKKTVGRMEDYRQRAGRPGMTEGERERVLKFLSRGR